MKTEQFNLLHQQAAPLMICNVWDVASSLAAQKLAFKAIGTSSAAIASTLGYEDGEEMAFEELLFIVKRILSCSKLPLTVDIEAGYSQDPLITAAYIKTLAKAGVVGINIEDSRVSGTRKLIDANIFAGYLSAIKGQLVKDKVDIFMNVRTDTFIMGLEDALLETQKRASLYTAAGADGLFVPCITNIGEIQSLVSNITVPLNVMCMPDLADFDSLASLGVKRISMGNFLFDKLQADFETRLNQIDKEKSFVSLF